MSVSTRFVGEILGLERRELASSILRVKLRQIGWFISEKYDFRFFRPPNANFVKYGNIPLWDIGRLACPGVIILRFFALNTLNIT